MTSGGCTDSLRIRAFILPTIAGTCLFALSSGAGATDSPKRVVSMNLCTHQFSVMSTFAARSRRGALVLVALHDINLASAWCNRLVILKEGSVVCDGAPQDILSTGLMAEVYGVESRITNDSERPVVMPTGLVETFGAQS